jgi:hypothetical protein
MGFSAALQMSTACRAFSQNCRRIRRAAPSLMIMSALTDARPVKMRLINLTSQPM